MGIVRDRFNNIVAVEYKFSTMNNVNDNAFLDIDKGECSLLQNVDLLDDQGGVVRRKGYTATTITDDIHSGWSDGTIGYYIKSGALYSFDGVTERYLTYVGSGRCCFVTVNNIIVFSNGFVIGSIENGVASLFPEVPVSEKSTWMPNAAGADIATIDGSDNTPFRTLTKTTEVDLYAHKVKTVAGQCLEFYNGRLYIGSGNTLYCSETFNIEQMDERFNIVAMYDSRITMVRRTVDGLIIGTELETFFLSGKDQQEGGFEQIVLAAYGSVFGTDVFILGENIKDGGPGEAALWCSTRGICFCGQGGSFKNLTEDYYTYKYGSSGCGLIRFKDGQIHYIANVAQEQTAFNQNAQPQLDVDSIEY